MAHARVDGFNRSIHSRSLSREKSMDLDADPAPSMDEETSERAQLSGTSVPKRPDAATWLSAAAACLVVVVIVAFSFQNGITLFSFHPTFMISGWLIFMTSALNAFSPVDITVLIFPNATYQQRVLRHWVFQVCSLVCVTIGFIIIVANKIRADKYHFTTLHGCFGLATFILTILTVLGGIVTIYSNKIKKILSPVYIKLSHSGLGLTTYILGIVTIILALYSNWWSNGNIIRLIILITLLGIMLSTILRPCIKFYIRITERLEYLKSST